MNWLLLIWSASLGASLMLGLMHALVWLRSGPSRSARDSAVRISISDVGCGLPECEAERVFQPFFTTKPQGLGIGLAITRSIVEAHRGRLWAEANPGAGTVFHLELPALSSSQP